MNTNSKEQEAIIREALRMVNPSIIYLSPNAYAKLWGLARSTVDEMISEGEMTVRNGALKEGSEAKGKHKQIHRFFNPYQGRMAHPLLPIEEGGSDILGWLKAFHRLLDAETFYVNAKEYAKAKKVPLAKVRDLIRNGYITHKNGGLALGTGTSSTKYQHRLYLFFDPNRCEVSA